VDGWLSASALEEALDRSVIPIYVGFDQREAVAYHAFCQSVIAKTSRPVAFIPLHGPALRNFDGQRDGTNAFIFSRYLVPYLCGYAGWALFFDGDMICNEDVAELFAYKDMYADKAACVVKHDYKTKHPRKYVGSKIENANVDYPRKNWSSVVLWNCGHPANRLLNPEFVADATPAALHRFTWLSDSEIGELPTEWNNLVGEYPPGSAKLDHYTLGVPGLRYYADCHASWRWHKTLINALECAGENPVRMIERAEDRIGEL
jgi:hypothetical protein